MKPSKDDKELAAYAKALGHPIRVQIMRQLEQLGTCQTGALVDSLPVAQSTVSEHLRILREAGLVCGEIDGPRRCYCVNAQSLNKARCLFQDL